MTKARFLLHNQFMIKEQIHSLPPTRARMEFELQIALSQSVEGVGGSEFTRLTGRAGVLVFGISPVLQIVDNRLPNRLIVLQKS